MHPLLLSKRQAAKLLGIGRDTLAELIRGGHLRTVAVLEAQRVSRAECERLARSEGERAQAPRQAIRAACDADTIPECAGVYFVGSPEVPQLVKIGVSVNLRERIAGLQAGSPVPLRLLAWKRGDRYAERDEHARWASLRVRGEWFRFEGALKEHVRALSEECA